jgi:hypothetical protein
MAAPYPSIDAGYIHDPAKKLDCLMSDFFEAEHSQSYLFFNQVTSFPWIIQQYQTDPNEIINQLRVRLRPYLLRYFDDVDIECALIDNQVTTTSYSIRLYVEVQQDGALPVNLVNQINISDNNKFERSIALRT